MTITSKFLKAICTTGRTAETILKQLAELKGILEKGVYTEESKKFATRRLISGE